MKLFSAQGRATRLEYFLHNLGYGLFFLVYIIAGMILFSSQPEGDSPAGIYFAGAVLIYFLLILLEIFTAIRRFHDLGRPGTHVLLLLIPFYNIYLGFILLCTKGTVGSNEFGPDPLPAPETGSAVPIE